MKYLFLFVFYFVTYNVHADLKCSANGTQLIYINGVNVDSEFKTIDTKKKIDDVIKLSIKNIDLNGQVEKTDHVYNTSRKVFEDVEKLKVELVTNAPNGISKEQAWLGLVAKELDLDKILPGSYEDFKNKQQINPIVLDRAKKALAFILSKSNLKKSIDNKTFLNSDFYKDIARYNQNVANVLANAATEVDTLVKLKTKIDTYYKQHKKVIVVSHSQGNEALRASLQLYRSELTTTERVNFDKVFGTLQVAPPSPVLATPCSTASTDTNPSCHSRFIKLDKDLVIGGSKIIISDNEPITPNYIYNNSFSNASGYKDIPLIGGLLEYFYNLALGAAFHGMDEIYLNEKIYANSVENNELLPMTDVFNRRIAQVGETLEDNCSKITISAQATDPDYFHFEAFFNRPDGTSSVVSYQWDFGDGTTAVSTSKFIDHIYSSTGTFTVTVKVHDQFETVSASTSIDAQATVQPYTKYLKTYCQATYGLNVGIDDNSDQLYATGMCIEFIYEYHDMLGNLSTRGITPLYGQVDIPNGSFPGSTIMEGRYSVKFAPMTCRCTRGLPLSHDQMIH